MRKLRLCWLIPSSKHRTLRDECIRSASGQIPTHVDLLGYGQSVVYLDPEITDRAFELCVAQEYLDSADISRASVNQGGFVRRSECVP